MEKVFRMHYDMGIEIDSQCCVYFKGNKVVDLWGSTINHKNNKNKFKIDRH